MESMITFCKVAPQRGGEFVEKPIPTYHEDEVLIEVIATSICGTDVHIYQWDAWAQSRIPIPQTMGHEFVGKIIAKGSKVTTHQIGDVVVAETHIVCNECEFCLSNQAHICEKTQVLGVDRDGSFAQYIAIPASNAIKPTITTTIEHLSILEPLGNAVHTVLSGDVLGKTIAVVGCGPIGLMAIDVAKALGAKQVFGIEVNQVRLDLAMEIGADYVINPLKEDPIQRILELTNQKGVDVVCEMSGQPIAINQAYQYLKPGGRMAMLGVPSKEVTINVSRDIVFKGISIFGITGRKMFETWDQVKALLDSKKLHLDKIITHQLPFKDVVKGMELMESGNCGKVVLLMPPGRE